MKAKLYNNSKAVILAMSIAAMLAIPAFAGAQSASPQTFGEYIQLLLITLSKLIPLIVGLTILVLFWGLAKFIANAGDQKSHEEGKALMIWGSLALFVMVTIWGILAFLTRELGFGSGGLKFKVLPESSN